MGKLVDADKMIHYQTYDDEHEEFREHTSTIADFLDAMTDEGCPKTVDAVPVQRCDGCRYADWHSNGCIAYCTKHGSDGHVADSFCSEGEKVRRTVTMTDYPTREYIIRETTYPDATKQELIGELVRCKDCEHHEDYGGFMYCERHSMTVTADYYCGDGKDGDA